MFSLFSTFNLDDGVAYSCVLTLTNERRRNKSVRLSLGLVESSYLGICLFIVRHCVTSMLFGLVIAFMRPLNHLRLSEMDNIESSNEIKIIYTQSLCVV